MPENLIELNRMYTLGETYALFNLDNAKFENAMASEDEAFCHIASTETRSRLRIKYNFVEVDENGDYD